MLTIIDLQFGNLGSLSNMLNYLSIKSEISNDIKKILSAKKLIFCGVGSFDNAMKRIHENKELKETIDYVVLEKKIPILGICLGMHLMMDKSEEGKLKGLSWIKGSVKKFTPNKNFKVPHMGWNYLEINKENILTNLSSNDAKYYFVHSYYVDLENKSQCIFSTNHFINFASGFNHENIFGIQFHPEKSHKHGMNILKNFSEI